MSTYLSSKMAGLPDYGAAGFKAEAEWVLAHGGHPFTPKARPGTPWMTCVRDDLFCLTQCEAIRMFGPWYRSHGALIELISAHRMGIRIGIDQWFFRPLQWFLNKTKGVQDGL